MLRLKLICSLIGLTIALSSIGFADCRVKITLGVTSAGATNDISGTAEIRARRERQRFKVSMDARVAEGTTFGVYTDGKLAGTITIDALGNGQLELDNDDGRTLPAAVNPVCSIKTVEVKDQNGVVVLQGSF
jgi:hypothetical protein